MSRQAEIQRVHKHVGIPRLQRGSREPVFLSSDEPKKKAQAVTTSTQQLQNLSLYSLPHSERCAFTKGVPQHGHWAPKILRSPCGNLSTRCRSSMHGVEHQLPIGGSVLLVPESRPLSHHFPDAPSNKVLVMIFVGLASSVWTDTLRLGLQNFYITARTIVAPEFPSQESAEFLTFSYFVASSTIRQAARSTRSQIVLNRIS